jgi:hypothetical protein
MDQQSLERWRGLEQLLHDGVEIGATTVESYHRRASARPFDILESIKPIAVPTRIVRVIHDGILTLSYGSIRTINRGTAMLRNVRIQSPDSSGR